MVTAKGTTLVYGRTGDTSAGIISYSQGSSSVWMIHDSTGTPLGYSDGSNPYAFGTDGLGSTTSIVSPSGTQAAAYTYGPFGETTPDTGWEAAVNLIRYTGGFHEPNTGLLKLGRRFYDTGRARFTQQDALNTIGDPTNANRYAYAADNPTNNTDPTGRFPWLKTLQAGAACLEGGLAAAEAVSPFAAGIGAASGGIGAGAVEAGAAAVGCGVAAYSSWEIDMNAITGTP
ncbi:RHS repeat-associated core domain-containing protein [Actinomadura terrae]|uniref:RHS repeat-associated core domain-containing protein n=1 Tax=Actinomadura terrae TaxID=604353 RepID=UPI001FA741D7|nr:RHS repeat-associated core domain-containing protein [Actinomadura terrae]